MIFCPVILIFLCVHMCLYVGVCLCVHTYVYMWVRVCMCDTCVYMGACLCVCICVYVDACFCVCMCGCVFMCVDVWRSEISLKSHSPCFLKHGLSMVWSSLIWPDYRDPSIHLCLTNAVIISLGHHTQLFCMNLGINLRSSGLHNKRFTDWAISVGHFNVLSMTLMKTLR